MIGSADVAVVGGGAIGLASAWRLAQRGLAVELFDPDPGAGASSVAAGMLAPVTEARLGEEALLQLGLASWALWPDFAAEVEDASDQPIGYRSDGTVMVALDADDRAAMADLLDRQRLLGLEVTDLSAGEVRSREPALAPGVRRGALAAGERSVDPAVLVQALLGAVERAGVVIRRERVVALGHLSAAAGTARPASGADGPSGSAGAPGDRVCGVVLESGASVLHGTVVLAAGAWSAGLDPRSTVRPVKGQILTVRQRADDVVVRHTVRGFVRGSSIYLVPRDDGRVVCGATVEERGWDAAPTAGGAYELLRDVLSLFPGLDEAELVGVRTGFRPGTPDDLPLIGPGPVDGLVVATGHYRNGILLTPITADAVVALVTGEAPPAEVAPCDPARFTQPAATDASTAGSSLVEGTAR